MFVEKAIFNECTNHDSNLAQALLYKNICCISAKTKSFKKGNNIILTTKCIHIFIFSFGYNRSLEYVIYLNRCQIWTFIHSTCCYVLTRARNTTLWNTVYRSQSRVKVKLSWSKGKIHMHVYVHRDSLIMQ